MALAVLRLRRAVSLSSSSLIKHPFLSSSSASIPSLAPPPLSSAAPLNPSSTVLIGFRRNFRSSVVSLSFGGRPSFRHGEEEIGPDTILFEGCDYNHWLITMDFPKDPAPTREEMIETYLQTLAKVVGSYEEAKKKMYACSTTTYQGFQCLVSEEESEKFRGLPGVVFILPDSYIDPVNKEYGGDKYENGVITPRPPPMQYGRQGRYGDRNRDYNRDRPRDSMPNRQGNQGYANQGPPPRQDNQGYFNQGPARQDNQGYVNQGPAPGRSYGPQQNLPMPNQQGNSAYQNQGHGYGDTRNFGQQQTPPMQPNFPAGGDRRDPLPLNNAPGGRDPMPPNQVNYNQNQQRYYNPQVPSEQRAYAGDNRNYAPQQDLTQGQGAGGNYGQMGRTNYGQGSGDSYGQTPGGNYQQGSDNKYGQTAGVGYGQGTGQGFNQQSHPGPMEQQRSSNTQGEQKNYGQMGQSWGDQGRY